MALSIRDARARLPHAAATAACGERVVVTRSWRVCRRRLPCPRLDAASCGMRTP
jgi:hypothetical protein